MFVDTIEAKCHCCAVVGKEHGWKHEGNGDFWRKDIKFHHGKVLLTFKPDIGQKGLEVKEGTVKVKFSVPKVFYGDNIAGVYCSDCFFICSSINKLLRDELIFTTGVGLEIGFANFQVTRVDRSICSDAVTPKLLEEMLRIFKLLYFPYHKPGKRCSKDYNYETSFCHTSDSEDILAYDKSAETKKHLKKDEVDISEDVPEQFEDDNDIFENCTASSEEDSYFSKNNNVLSVNNDKLLSVKDNIFRIEISSKKPLKFYGDFGTVKGVLTSNKALIRLLSYRKLHLDFVPEQEYWKLITTRFEKEKKKYLSDPNRASKAYPHYITRKLKSIISHLKYINEKGSPAAHEENDELYNDCVELTSKLGISVIYTTQDERLNFFSEIYRRADTDKIFLRDSQAKATDEYINECEEYVSDTLVSSVHRRIHKSKNGFIRCNQSNKKTSDYKSVNCVLPFHSRCACYKRE